ncbi:MAG: bile acid:sodium symporter family protein, partial [Bacteroidota bacterium]
MDQLSSLIVGICLMLIMLGMGLSLTIQDFQRIALKPKAVIIGLLNQLLFLPVIGFMLAKGLDMPSTVAIGIMILAACPGGATSNLIAHLAKGDTALSVTLTAIASLLTIFTIPLIIHFSILEFASADEQIDLNAAQMIGQLFAIVIVPVALGMLLKYKKPAFALRMDKPVRTASGILLAIVTVALIIRERENIIPFFQEAGVATILLNVTTIGLGFLTARLARLQPKQGLSIAIESGIQNSALAMTIATVTLQNTSFGIAAAIYTLVM